MDETSQASPPPSKKQNLLPWADYPFFTFILWKTVKSPLDVVRIRYQCDSVLQKSNLITSPYNSSWDCLRRTISKEGKTALWKGNTASLLMYLPNQLIESYFSQYLDKIENRLSFDREKKGYIKWRTGILLNQGLRGTLAKTFTFSLDYARTRLINDIGNKEFSNVFDVYRKVIATKGVWALYRGFHVSLAGMLTFNLLNALFEDIFLVLLPNKQEKNTNLKFTLGILAQILASVLTCPLDTVKRRMMMASTNEEMGRGVIEWLKYIAKNEGIRGLFKGASVTAMVTAATAAVLVPVFILSGLLIINIAVRKFFAKSEEDKEQAAFNLQLELQLEGKKIK